MRSGFLIMLSLHLLSLSTWGQSRKFDRQGHRGSRGLMPENTIPAMIEAIKLGVNTIEMDVVISKDKQIVVSHEPFMNPEISTPPINDKIQIDSSVINLYQMPYAEIEKWDVGLKYNHRFPKQQKIALKKPLLSTLIDSVEEFVEKANATPIYYNIEIKSSPSTDGLFHPGPDEFVELLINLLQNKNIISRTTIQSFDKRPLQYLHTHFPHVVTSYLLEGSNLKSLDEIIKELGFTPDIISPVFKSVNKEFINACHLKGIKVIAWTVNERSKILELYQMGIDGVISDYPDMFDVIDRK